MQIKRSRHYVYIIGSFKIGHAKLHIALAATVHASCTNLLSMCDVCGNTLKCKFYEPHSKALYCCSYTKQNVSHIKPVCINCKTRTVKVAGSCLFLFFCFIMMEFPRTYSEHVMLMYLEVLPRSVVHTDTV